MDAPLAVVEQRDPKGLYKKARAGEIKGMQQYLTGASVRFSYLHVQISPAFLLPTSPQRTPRSTLRRTNAMSPRRFAESLSISRRRALYREFPVKADVDRASAICYLHAYVLRCGCDMSKHREHLHESKCEINTRLSGRPLRVEWFRVPNDRIVVCGDILLLLLNSILNRIVQKLSKTGFHHRQPLREIIHCAR